MGGRTIRKFMAATGVVAFAAALSVSPAGASTYAGTVAITCTDITASGTGAETLDRDNTGTGDESLIINVTDGDGTVIYNLPFTNALGTYSGGLLPTTAYTTPPDHNPITFTLTSVAGNSLPEQVDVNVSGECASLPWVAPDATAPETATQGTTVAVTGTGCPAGPVTAELHQTVGDGTPLVSGTDTVTGTTDPFSIDLIVPTDAPVGAEAIEVFCGSAAEPTSEVGALPITISAPVAPTTAAPTTTAPPAATPVQATPAFTG
jgi:hypothetical protein